jgi:transposase-like protein
MKKQTINPERKCPKCGKAENQVGRGKNASGTQRCKCKECGTSYTINPKRNAYPTETVELALKIYYSGVSGRGVGHILNMSKANVYNWIKKKRLKARGLITKY